ncbi:hypothetical protein M3665_26880, partial [Bacillus licheniformis]|nr:hypothetical protein [Bacillus licheniformis]
AKSLAETPAGVHQVDDLPRSQHWISGVHLPRETAHECVANAELFFFAQRHEDGRKVIAIKHGIEQLTTTEYCLACIEIRIELDIVANSSELKQFRFGLFERDVHIARGAHRH